MKGIKTIIISLVISLSLASQAMAGTTILPAVQEPIPANQSVEDWCLKKYKIWYDESSTDLEILIDETFSKSFTSAEQETFLSCGIATGYIHLWMIPHYLVYWTESLLALTGIIAVLMFVIGGIFYMLGGVSETITKEKGKTTMKWALMGMALSFLSWVIVNVFLYFVSQ